ncbi:MAG: hypothetical protein JXR63_13365 [Spirochaetales bacterium]|nr:hypothetical protein [Spirochaetales bacterium]
MRYELQSKQFKDKHNARHQAFRATVASDAASRPSNPCRRLSVARIGSEIQVILNFS